jgi:U4/U6.U5 tri-snRNP-associated protein 2
MSEDEEELESIKFKRPRIAKETVKGLYLETVDRHKLDFDFEKLCSVSLSNMNVYACLSCGKYFQGILNSLKGRSGNSISCLLSFNE